MPDGSVALQTAKPEEAAERLASALTTGSLRASVLAGRAAGAWFGFETPHGAGAFRVVSAGGLAMPAPAEGDGAGAAGQVERAEATLTLAEAALGVAIAPNALGPVPEGIGALVEHEEAGTVLALVLPEAVAETLAPASAPSEAVLHRARLAAPALGPADIPASGDLLVLGSQIACELSPQRPAGAAAFTATLALPDAGPGAPIATPGGAVASFEALLAPGQAAALRAGEPLTLGEGAAPAATYAANETIRTGTLMPVGGAIWFRFD